MKATILAFLSIFSLHTMASNLSIYCHFPETTPTVAAYILTENGRFAHIVSFPTTSWEGSPELRNDTYLVKNVCRPGHKYGRDSFDCSYAKGIVPISISLPAEFVIGFNESSYITGGFSDYGTGNAPQDVTAKAGPFTLQAICKAVPEVASHREFLNKKLGYKSHQ